jgi:hypothetical protein
MSLVATKSVSPPLNWLSSFTVKLVGSMHIFWNLQEKWRENERS